MAKNAGRLAGLAALAGAAYMMSRGKDSGTTDSNPTRTARPEPTETRLKTQAESIKDADNSVGSGLSPISRGASGTTTLGPDTSEVDLNPARNAPAAPPPKVDPYANYEGGDLLPNTRSAPALNVPDAIKNENVAKSVAKAAQADANKAANAGNIKAASTKYSTATDQYKNLSRAAAVTDARKREAEQARTDALRSSGGRRAAGGAVKKMASGGMTSKVSSASKRADGIASRGKTRCKMY